MADDNTTTERLGRIEATLAGLATKAGLAELATKADLAGVANKSMLLHWVGSFARCVTSCG
jgi:hypothetical protein